MSGNWKRLLGSRTVSRKRVHFHNEQVSNDTTVVLLVAFVTTSIIFIAIVARDNDTKEYAGGDTKLSE